MNPKLEIKLNELRDMENGACWYIVKQDTNIIGLCYMIDLLEQYQFLAVKPNFEEYIKNEVEKINAEQGLKITTTHRALLVAAYIGLISKATKYENAIIKNSFYEIKKRCNGKFQNIELYQDIITRQIEKIFFVTSIDEQSQKTRKEYHLFPVMLMYKILLEIGISTKEYKISIEELKYLVSTTKRYKNFLETCCLIFLYRDDINASANFKIYEDKVSNRFHLLIKQLDTIVVSDREIYIKPEKIKEVSKKVLEYEMNMENVNFNDDEYLDFLYSDQSFLSNYNNTKNKVSNNSDSKNIIYYGVPGIGKSYTINNEYNISNHNTHRVVFHPDYTYSDFVGQILPKTIIDENGNKKLDYNFAPGPFTRALKQAKNMPNEDIYLIIEEINRGNAPAIFGDLFQLLDRNDDGESSYKITNIDISKEVFGNENEKIYLPSNLYIIATMNTADQNVFTLDTAFQRRWEMKHMRNPIEKASTTKIANSGVSWKKFITIVNEIITNNNDGFGDFGDKRLGAFFANNTEIENSQKFASKVLKYLWDDAFKMDREKLFKKELRSIDEMLEKFEINGKFEDILDVSICDKLNEKDDKLSQNENIEQSNQNEVENDNSSNDES